MSDPLDDKRSLAERALEAHKQAAEYRLQLLAEREAIDKALAALGHVDAPKKPGRPRGAKNRVKPVAESQV